MNFYRCETTHEKTPEGCEGVVGRLDEVRTSTNVATLQGAVADAYREILVLSAVADSDYKELEALRAQIRSLEKSKTFISETLKEQIEVENRRAERQASRHADHLFKERVWWIAALTGCLLFLIIK